VVQEYLVVDFELAEAARSPEKIEMEAAREAAGFETAMAAFEV